MAYLGKTPSQAVRSRYYYTATGGETSLSGADDNSNVLTFTDGNYVDVSLNGVALVAGTDYNTTTTNTIGGLTALVASDVVEVIVYDTFSVFGGNMAADLNFKDNVKANFGTGNDLQIFHDGSNSIIRDAGTGSLKFQYGTSDGVVIDSSGNVGIGTSSPSSFNTTGGKLVVASGAGNVAALFSDAAYYTLGVKHTGVGTEAVGMFGGTAGSSLALMTNNAEAMRIDISGNVGIGTSSPAGQLHVFNSSAGEQYISSSTSAIRFVSTGGENYIQSGTATTGSSPAPLIFTNVGGTNETMRINSSGNVGIGTSSPQARAEISGGLDNRLRINSTDGTTSNNYGIDFSTAGTVRAGIRYNAGNNYLAFYGYDNTERMRIDPSGNLLVGTTSTTLTGNAGFTYQGGITTTSNNGSLSAIMNRNTNDGEIVQFRKDNTTVGSIGTLAGFLTVGTGDTGLLFQSSVDNIQPFNLSTNSDRPNAIDIGDASNRFKDLYLSGGVVFGATGGAVTGKTLDDYEEGTWTPASGGGTPAPGSDATYIKIGRSVTVMADVTFTGVTSPTHIITGLPFQSNGVQAGACIAWNNSSRYLSLLAPPSTSTLTMYDQLASTQNINNNNRLIFSVTYQT